MSAEPYTADDARADVTAWFAATEAQRAEAFWELRSVVSADALLGDEYCAKVLRALAAKRDAS